jgi:hypothetical protein
MPHLTDVLQILAVLAAAVVMVVVLRARHRGKAVHDEKYAHENLCEHLKPALLLLESNGHRVTQVGQLAEEMPLEIHLHPPFDPHAIYKQLELAPPVYVSDRNVLFCKDDWCELHPAR